MATEREAWAHIREQHEPAGAVGAVLDTSARLVAASRATHAEAAAAVARSRALVRRRAVTPG